MLRDLLSFQPLYAAEVEAGAPEPEQQPLPLEPAAQGAEPEAPAEQPSGEPDKSHGNAGKPPWFMERIHGLTDDKREALQRAEEAERRAQAAEELLRRLQSGGSDPPAGDAPARLAAPVRQPGQSQTDYDAAVAAGVAQKTFQNDVNAMFVAGKAEFPNFQADIDTLVAAGVGEADFVEDVFAVDKANAHKIFAMLAKDPDKAREFATMTSRQRIAQLTRMTMTEAPKPAPPPPKPVSAAPAPKPAIEPVAASAGGDEFADDVSDAAFSAAWDKKFLKRA